MSSLGFWRREEGAKHRGVTAGRAGVAVMRTDQVPASQRSLLPTHFNSKSSQGGTIVKNNTKLLQQVGVDKSPEVTFTVMPAQRQTYQMATVSRAVLRNARPMIVSPRFASFICLRFDYDTATSSGTSTLQLTVSLSNLRRPRGQPKRVLEQVVSWPCICSQPMSPFLPPLQSCAVERGTDFAFLTVHQQVGYGLLIISLLPQRWT
jgi:hypothetical protein